MASDVPTQDPEDVVADVKEKLHELEQVIRGAVAAGVRVELDIRYDQIPNGGPIIPYVVAEFSRSM